MTDTPDSDRSEVNLFMRREATIGDLLPVLWDTPQLSHSRWGFDLLAPFSADISDITPVTRHDIKQFTNSPEPIISFRPEEHTLILEYHEPPFAPQLLISATDGMINTDLHNAATPHLGILLATHGYDILRTIYEHHDGPAHALPTLTLKAGVLDVHIPAPQHTPKKDFQTRYENTLHSYGLPIPETHWTQHTIAEVRVEDQTLKKTSEGYHLTVNATHPDRAAITARLLQIGTWQARELFYDLERD